MIPLPPSSGRARPKPFADRSRALSLCWRWSLAVLCLALAWHAMRGVAWIAVWDLLSRIGPAAITILMAVNLLMLSVMTARWWLLLRVLDSPVGMFTACAYRVAVNAINYLTPGPHFGGEPLSVYLLRRRHGVSLSSAVTSVALDRLLELLASMVVLTFGLVLLAATPQTGSLADGRGLAIAAGVLAMLSLMLAALFTGKRPLSRFVFLFKKPERRDIERNTPDTGSLTDSIAQGEAMAEFLFRRHHSQFLLANFFSLSHWVVVFVEFWLMSVLLGVPLSFWQVTAVVVVARLAFFTPLPAGLGVLESALPWVTATIGQGSALGISLCIIIRSRDLVFSVAGLALMTRYLTCCSKVGIVK